MENCILILKAITILILGLGLAQSNAQVNELADSGNTYENALVELEKIRKLDRPKFDAGLVSLAPKLGMMNEADQCHYNYLVIYKESFKGDYTDSIKALEDLRKTCGTPEHLARIAQFLANLQVITGDFEPALKNLNTAIQITESTEDQYLRSLTNNVAAISYRLMNQDEISLKYADLLITGDFTEDDKCMGEFNKYRIFMRQGKGIDFKDEIVAAINRCENVRNHIASLFLQFDQIRYEFSEKNGHVTEALAAVQLLDSLAEAVDKTNFKNIKVYYHALQAHVYWVANLNEEAQFYGELAIKENASIGESEQLVLALDVLINLSLENKSMQSAYQYLASKNNIEKSIYERKLATQVAYYRVKHTNLAQELQIEQLNQNNKLLELENKLAEETAKKQQLIMLLIVSLLLLLGVWTYKIKKRHDYFKEVAEIDHLTQVFTRKAFEEKVKEMLEASEASKQTVNVAIMDLDHFKNVNDQFGHLVGDWVLKQVILTCEEVADQDILVARLGGEEFSIVSPGITQLEMMRLMEKMRHAIEHMDCSESGATFEITASFGVTSTIHSGYRTSMLLTHADLALFEAKNKGRNEVVAYDEIMRDIIIKEA